MKILRSQHLPAATLLLCLAACSGVVQEQAPDFAFGDVTTFAWKEDPRFAPGVEDGELEALRQLERRVQRVLERRRVELVPKARAHVVLSATLNVVTKVHSQDRTYSQYASEQYEEGVLRLEVYDRPNRRLVWAGEDRARLRTTGRAFGGLVQRFEPTDEPRVWPIEQMVEKILAALPR